MMLSKIKGYYFITDSDLSKSGNISDVKNAVESGVGVVQYRNKSGSTKEMYEEAVKLKEICKNIIFLINDRIDIAIAVDADGVHIGQDDMPYKIARKMLGKNKIIGVTVHNVQEAKDAEKIGADYLGVSPVFSTDTKPDAGKPAGINIIKDIKRICKIPLIAIGGINLLNAEEVVKAGADGLCAISAVVAKDDVKAEIIKFQKLF
ncbi:MAG: thiamine-phosphate diphosphorylase [Elusimicrobia bacterium RIFOXYD2_FULL_34_15]|nr:MAG: thiamine-phosphate diphosphorylase [Elusimicrobia bacterium RIFOXYD2_FULL_34_15]